VQPQKVHLAEEPMFEQSGLPTQSSWGSLQVQPQYMQSPRAIISLQGTLPPSQPDGGVNQEQPAAPQLPQLVESNPEQLPPDML